MMKKNEKSHRELVDMGRDKRFVRRNEKGEFDEVVDVGRSLAKDREQHAKQTVPPGQGDRGRSETNLAELRIADCGFDSQLSTASLNCGADWILIRSSRTAIRNPKSKRYVSRCEPCGSGHSTCGHNKSDTSVQSLLLHQHESSLRTRST
jgi:hypothetical protein